MRVGSLVRAVRRRRAGKRVLVVWAAPVRRWVVL